MASIVQYGKRAADVLATATNRGLLAATDFVKLQLLRFSGNRLLLPPDYTSFVAQETGSGATADAHLRAGGRYTFLEAPGNSHITANAYYDGTNWQRYNTAAAAYLFIVNAGGEFDFWTAAAGANPIAWNATHTIRPDIGSSALSFETQLNFQSIVHSARYIHLGANLALAPGGAAWNRINTAGPGILLRMGEDGNIIVWTTPAGANPATLTAVASFAPTTLGLVTNPPRFRAYYNAAQVVATNVWTTLTYPNVSYNTGGTMYGAPYNAGTSTFTAPVAGVYHADAYAYVQSASNVPVGIGLVAQGGFFWATQLVTGPASLDAHVAVSADIFLAAGQTIIVQGYQNSLANKNFVPQQFAVRWVSNQ
jgi:hypothetical protein